MCSRLASEQKGVVSRLQLLRAGLSRHVIDGLIASGYLHIIFRGVYAVGHLALPPFGIEQAAVLAGGQEAVVSHASALHLWGLIETPPRPVHVTVPRSRRLRAGIRVHRSGVPRRDMRRRYGLRTASPARAIIEFAASASSRELEDVVAEARVKRLLKDGELERALDRAGRAPGAAAVRRFLRNEGGPQITRSRAERHFKALLREARLPQPKSNARVAGFEVDFLWEAEKVVVEVDSWQFHGHRRAFERDRRKDLMLGDAGYVAIRVTWRQFTEEMLALITHLARALDRRARGAH